VHLVGDAIDEDADDYSVEAAMSKVFASEALWVVSNEALQIAGGNGFMKEYPYERIVRDSRINMIFEGTNEILRLYIGLSGAKEVGDYLTALGRNIGEFRTDPLKGLGVITEYASQKFAHLTSWGLERIPGLPEAVRATEEKLLKHTGDLRNSTEIVLRRYGKTISDQQLIVRRLADVALDLYGSYATMSRIGTMCTRTNPSELGAELAILRSFTHDARHRIRRNLRTLQRNEDGSVVLLADHLVKHGRYPWDTL
jgi:acyl-CoA dehydrogenase family member 9